MRASPSAESSSVPSEPAASRSSGSRLATGLPLTALTLAVILMVAAWMRWERLELRFNQITFAYAAYFQPYVAALEAGETGRLLTTFVGLHPPGYSLLFALFYALWGAPGGLHLLSGVFSVAAVGATFAVGRAAFGRAAGLMASALMAVSVYHLHYSLEVNNYPLLVLTAATTQWAAVRMIQAPGGRTSIRWALLAAMTIYTHALGAVLVALQAVVCLAVHRRRAGSPARALLLTGLVCFPLLPTVLSLAGRGSTYHNESPGWRALWELVPGVMSIRFGPRVVVVVLLVAAAVGLARALRRPIERPVALSLAASMLAAPVILLLSKAGIAASHQYPYYLMVLPSFLALAARGLAAPWPAPPVVAPGGVMATLLRLRAGGAVLLFALTAQWAFAAAEVAQADRSIRRFEDRPHALKLALAGAGEADVLWLIAPALFPDDDKRAADPVYGLLPRWGRCRYHQPRDLRFEYVDYQYGQPVTCGARLLYTFTDIYGSSMSRLLTSHRSRGERVWIVLYDYAAAPAYPARLEAVLRPFAPEKRQVGESTLYAVSP